MTQERGENDGGSDPRRLGLSAVATSREVAERAALAGVGFTRGLPTDDRGPGPSPRFLPGAVWIATVEAADADEAIEKAARERNVPATKLIATRRR